MFLSKIARDPIVHFLAAGAVLYLLVSLLRGDALLPADDKRITVDRASLLTYMQYQSNAFDPATFEAALDNMDEELLQQLIDAYVSEEVLYREAAALGLEQSDYIIRQRMVDKMRFLLADLSGLESEPTEAELQQWLEQNRELYRIQPSATFTHVFLDASARGLDEAQQRALALLSELNEASIGFNDAVSHGDRFPFLRNYVERTLDFVAGHFGTRFAQNLQQLQPDAAGWQGPLQSEYGYHLVLLTTLTTARDPVLDDVRAAVLRDFVTARNDEGLAQLVESVRAQYQVDASQLRSMGE